MEMEDNIKIKQDGIILKIKISPNASKNEIKSDNGIIKVKVTAQPIENKANKAVIEFLSKFLKIPKTSISIVKGETSKEKTLFFEIKDEVKKDEVFKKLEDIKSV